MKISLRVLGPERPDTFTSMTKSSVNLYDSRAVGGGGGTACVSHRDKKIYTTGYSDALSVNNLSQSYGCVNKATKLMRQVPTHLTKTFGADRPNTRSSKACYARVHVLKCIHFHNKSN